MLDWSQRYYIASLLRIDFSPKSDLVVDESFRSFVTLTVRFETFLGDVELPWLRLGANLRGSLRSWFHVETAECLL